MHSGRNRIVGQNGTGQESARARRRLRIIMVKREVYRFATSSSIFLIRMYVKLKYNFICYLTALMKFPYCVNCIRVVSFELPVLMLFANISTLVVLNFSRSKPSASDRYHQSFTFLITLNKIIKRYGI